MANQKITIKTPHFEISCWDEPENRSVLLTLALCIGVELENDRETLDEATFTAIPRIIEEDNRLFDLGKSIQDSLNTYETFSYDWPPEPEDYPEGYHQWLQENNPKN